MAGHELNPNRDVKRRSHTACVSTCAIFQSASPLKVTFVLHLDLPCTLNWLRHCRSRSAQSDQISTIDRPADVAVAQNDLPPSCATGPGPAAHPTSRSMTFPSPSVTLMIRLAADDNTTRDGRPLAKAGTSYVTKGQASYER